MTATAAAPEATGPDRWFGFVLCVALALLTWPLHEDWIDYEAPRRAIATALGGLALLHVALDALRSRFTGWRLFGPVGWLMLAFVLSEAGDPQRTHYWLALGAIGWFASSRSGRSAVARIGDAVRLVAVPVVTLVFAQRLGFDWPSGVDPSDPVGTLGNRGVAAEWLVLVLIVWSTGRPDRLGTLDWIGLGATAFAIGLLDNRNAFLATGFALVAITATAGWLPPADSTGPRKTGLIDRLRAPLVVALLVVLGNLAHATCAEPSFETADSVARAGNPAELIDGTTFDVRREIWQSSLELVAERPVIGHGAGSFRSEYPRVRSGREIEISSFGRRVPTEVHTAHNDLIEIFVEGGLVSLTLFVAIVAVLFRSVVRNRFPTGLAILVAMLALAMFRSPFLNAPAAALFVMVLGARPREQDRPATARTFTRPLHQVQRIGLVLLLILPALALIETGTRSLLGSVFAAEYRSDPSIARLDEAIEWDSREPSYRLMRLAARAGITENNLLAQLDRQVTEASEPDLRSLEDRAPDHPLSLLWRAQVARERGDPELALRLLDRQLRNDPEDPIAQQLEAVALVEEGRTEQALERLILHTAPRLRPSLGAYLTQLAEVPLIPDADHERLAWLGAVGTAVQALADFEPADAAAIDRAAIDRADAAIRLLERRGRSNPVALLCRARFRVLSGRADLATAMAPREPLSFDRFEQSLCADAIGAMATVERWSEPLREAVGHLDASSPNPR